MAKRWYIVQAYTNFEKKVAEAIQEAAAQQGLEECFEEIVVPTETVVEVRRNKKINVDRKFLPGYILVKMDMNDAAYHIIKNTPRVTGFLGSDNKPMPISEKEALTMISHGQVSDEKPRSTITYEVGETIRVSDGAFASFSGLVEEVDEEQSRLKVSVSIFGRQTPVELDFTQVEKVKE